MAWLCNPGWPTCSRLHFSSGSTRPNTDGSHPLCPGGPLGTSQLQFGLGNWKSLNVKILHGYSLQPGSPVFCGNPSVHAPKGWHTYLRSKRNRAVLQNNKTATLALPCPCPALVMNRPRKVPASVEGWEGMFPSSVLGGCFSPAPQLLKSGT